MSLSNLKILNPAKMFDKLRSFQTNLIRSSPWHYSNNDIDSTFCFPSIEALSVGDISTNNAEQDFVKTRFKNWKNDFSNRVWFSTTWRMWYLWWSRWKILEKSAGETIGGTLRSSGNPELQTFKRKPLIKTVSNIRYPGE